MIILVLDTILDLSRLPLKLAAPTVLQAMASFLVLHAVIATFPFGVKQLKKIYLLILMAQKEHFNAINAPQKISQLIITISEKSRKKTLNAFFCQKCPLLGHFGPFFLGKNERFVTQKN